MKLRAGRRVPLHLYAQHGPEPSDDDPPAGTMLSAELAGYVLELQRRLAELERHAWLLERELLQALIGQQRRPT